MVSTTGELQTALLRLLDTTNTRFDRRLGFGRSYLVELLPPIGEYGRKPNTSEFMEAVWSLIGQGLAYINMEQSAPENWSLFLTEAGKAAARDEQYNPDNAGGFLRQLESNVPDASPAVLQYAREAVSSYSARCYLASAVMLGVASEAAFLEMARSFASWLPTGQGEKLAELMERKNANFIARFDEFRKRIEPHKSSLPIELSDGMTLNLDAVLDLLRINRNEAGHPTGRTISREDAYISLQMFGRYVQKLYQLKAFFDKSPAQIT